ncbi:hypothetical protein Efla_003659 [Eimeria flavescens]
MWTVGITAKAGGDRGSEGDTESIARRQSKLQLAHPRATGHWVAGRGHQGVCAAGAAAAEAAAGAQAAAGAAAAAAAAGVAPGGLDVACR